MSVSCPRGLGSKFYAVEKAISRGRLNELCGLALMSKNGSDQQVNWDQIMEFALFKQDILAGNELKLSAPIICEALFYGFHMLVSRCLSKTRTANSSSVFLLVLDSKYGGVVKLVGDLSKLELNSSNPYKSVAEWIKNHAEVNVSPVDRIWNKFGNANWGDLGTLQILLATYNSIVQWNGPPRKSIASLVSDHSLRLQKRRMEFCLTENENGLVPFQQSSYQQGEIVELEQTSNRAFKSKSSRLNLKQGEVLLLEDQQQGQKTFQVQESLVGGNHYLYSAVCLDCPTELLTLYVGAHPSRLEPSWEDMSLWYQVQRQTKVLNIFKHQGITSNYLPEIFASGRILHSGPCQKQAPGGRCDHPWCGTPILVTSPVGEPVSYVVSQEGPLSVEEAIRCCRDCLAALRSAAMANVQHGDLCPENIIRVVGVQGSRNSVLYVPISWGRAVLEDRDSPAINLQFSSSHALQHGKLCPSSDAESLVYLMLFMCGGNYAAAGFNRICAAMERNKLGKAFDPTAAWAVDGVTDRGKMIEEVAVTLRLKDVAESSGTSAGVALRNTNALCTAMENHYKTQIQSFLKHLPPVEFCCVYGSSLHPNRGNAKSTMVDCILGVSDPQQWHSENLKLNNDHYASWMVLLGGGQTDHIGVGVHFNPFVSWNDKMFKYGVVRMHDLVRDISNWERFYLSGRLQKPVQIISDNLDIANVNSVNLRAAMSAALLLLPSKFTEEDLYAKICSLSYTGDLRMLFAEDRNKVKKIVQGQFELFRSMYKPFIEEYETKDLLRYSLSGNPQPILSQTILKRKVMVSSARQAVSGLLAVGGVNGMRYLGAKMRKAWNSWR
ncbi:hypothetical protein M0R45_014042 [Rubus argutus]|uniref:Phosphatidate cytidylyltransferase, mitochondrial n=1 Tax=Rubus argutus TaxID=59490 RepID=A0AAW1XL36_RUBAR